MIKTAGFYISLYGKHNIYYQKRRLDILAAPSQRAAREAPVFKAGNQGRIS
jgi:hypothetical protein